MKPGYLNKAITVLVLGAVLGFGTNVFALRDAGCPPEGNINQGQGQKRFCGNNCYMNKLSKEQIQKIHEQRKAFLNATENLRQKIYEKKTELTSVLAKKEPDAKKAKTIQKVISDLKSKLHQKKIDHIVKMKKINSYCGSKACGLRSGDKGDFCSNFRGCYR